MKKTITLSLMLCASLFLTAQNDSLFKSRTFRVQGQIGVNITTFVKQFLVLNNTAVTQTSPFDVNGKLLVGIKYAPSLMIGPRVGFGYSTSHNYSNNDLQNNERSSDNNSRSVRLGLELQQRLSKRWVLYYGADYINSTSSTSTVTTSIISTNTPPFTSSVRTEIQSSGKSTGGGPILGVQFNLNRWVCLGTETSFYYIQSKGGSKTSSSNPNNTIPETFTDSKSTQFLLPFFINCNIVF